MFRPFFRALLLRDRADASAHRAKRGGRSTNTLDPAVLLEPASGHPTSVIAYWFVACALLVPVPLLETLAAELPLDVIEGSWPYNLLERVSKEVVAHEYVRQGGKGGLLAPEVASNGTPAASLPRGRPGGRAAWPQVAHAAKAVPHPFPRRAARHPKGPAACGARIRVECGEEGTDELARRFAQTGEEHVSRAKRQAVV
jgi:hypothetical protein